MSRYPSCELCGGQIKGRSAAADFAGRGGDVKLGMPTDGQLDSFLPPGCKHRRAAKRGASGLLHNETAPRNCYRLCYSVHRALDAQPPTEPETMMRTRSAPPAQPPPPPRPTADSRSRQSGVEQLAAEAAAFGTPLGLQLADALDAIGDSSRVELVDTKAAGVLTRAATVMHTKCG